MPTPLPDWSYLRNVFNNVTSSNFKRMLSLSADHKAKLLHNSLTNPDINTLYLLFEPIHTAFTNKYTAVTTNFGAYKSATKTVETLAAELSSKHIKSWDIKIQNVYEDHTAEYELIMHNGRAPFQSGTYEQRLLAVESLAESLASYPLLSTVLTSVQAFATAFKTARLNQQALEGADSSLRVELEQAREDLALVMHRIFGQLIFLFADQPGIIESYYELQYLKAPVPKPNPNPSININANSRQQAMEGLFVSTDNFELENTGDNPLGFFLTEDELNPTPDNLMVMQPDAKQVYSTAELSDTTTPRKLLVVNLNSTAGKFKARLVQEE
ncbi:MAG: hypothetical protein IPM47_09330 [Sphingobacteriales bacterium]|nr:MAG: hypothetical protein IPM47_09330 [Sphingobacteriales bacterium]